MMKNLVKSMAAYGEMLNERCGASWYNKMMKSFY